MANASQHDHGKREGIKTTMRYNGTYHLIGAFSIALLVVLGVLMGGCSSKEESTSTKPKPTTKPTQVAAVPTKAPTAKVEVPSKQVKKEEPTKPAPAKALPVDLGTKIAEAKDFFTWYDLREVYNKAGVTDAKVEEALKAKETELLKAHPPKSVTKGLELVAFEWKALEDVKVTEMGKYQSKLLFHSSENAAIKTNEKVDLLCRIYPKQEHRVLFEQLGLKDPYQNGKPATFVEYWPIIKPSAQDWRKGTYILVKSNFHVPRIPYRLEITFTKGLKEGKYLGPYGHLVVGTVED